MVTLRRISSLSMSTCKASSISCKTCSSTLFNFKGCEYNKIKSNGTNLVKRKGRVAYRIRNKVSWMNFVSPFFHVLGSSFFVQIRYQMEKLCRQKKLLHVESRLTFLNEHVWTRIYQTGWIASGHDEIHKNRKMSIVLPKFCQRFEHGVIVDLSLI